MGGGIGSILYRVTGEVSTNTPPGEFFVYNAVGSTVALPGSNAAVQAAARYEAFGNLVGSEGSSDNNRLANTKEFDASLGLYNHGHRYYDPEIGRCISADPIGYGDGMNVYAYVHNNPVTGIDPTGLAANMRILTSDQAYETYDWVSWHSYPRPLDIGGTLFLLSASSKVVGGFFGMGSAVAGGTASAPTGVGPYAAGGLFVLSYDLSRSGIDEIVTGYHSPTVIESTTTWLTGSPTAGQYADATTLLFLTAGMANAAKLDALIGRAALAREESIISECYGLKLTPNVKGELGKGWSRSAAIARGETIVGDEVELIFQIGNKRVKVRADLLTKPRGQDSYYVYIESKYSPSAPYTPNQCTTIPELVFTGDSGLVAEIGSRSGTLLPGTKIRVVFQGDVWDSKPTLFGQ